MLLFVCVLVIHVRDTHIPGPNPDVRHSFATLVNIRLATEARHVFGLACHIPDCHELLFHGVFWEGVFLQV